MVHEYATRFYFPASGRGLRLSENGHQGARELAEWKKRAAGAWPQVAIVEINGSDATELLVGQALTVRARVSLAGLGPGELEVQIYTGEVSPEGELVNAEAIPMIPSEDPEDGTYWFRGEIPCRNTGHRGYQVRVLPYHPSLTSPFVPGLIRWGSDKISDSAPRPVHV